ncbi:hypothetical protein ACH5RR_008743 [Cinchona calisaya]|uniref:Uncharacterized protein n=1 Tax=Cinchona calisaya TaxID=153742 RepID=A0ABD3AEP7_9GENT
MTHANTLLLQGDAKLSTHRIRDFSSNGTAFFLSGIAQIVARRRHLKPGTSGEASAVDHDLNTTTFKTPKTSYGCVADFSEPTEP